MEAILACRGVRKAWGGVRALDGVDLAVGRGEIIGLAGPNGAGKTTLLNGIGGQIALDDGRISLGSESIERLRPTARRRLGIGRTFQSVRVFSRKSAAANVALASVYGRRRVPSLRFTSSNLEEAHDALGLVGLDGMASVTAGELSIYGQKRLMLAMALVPLPTLLLLDEPAGGLSPEEVNETAALLEAIRERGTTVVVVDHVMSFLREVVDRLVILHEGRVLVDGLPDTVIEDTRVRDIWLGHDQAVDEDRDSTP